MAMSADTSVGQNSGLTLPDPQTYLLFT
jgi:hypothetical protein